MANIQVPDALTSPFDVGTVNPHIALVEDAVVLRKGAESLALDRGRLFVSSRPKPELKLTADGVSSDSRYLDLALRRWSPRRIEFPSCRGRGRFVRDVAQVGGNFTSQPFQISAQGHVRELTTGNATKLRSAAFHLINFHHYVGSWIADGSARWSGRIHLDDGEWGVTVDQRRDLEQLKEGLQEEGGYAVTHICRLANSGGRFSTLQAQDLIESLHWFFSFVRGAWVSPCLVVGEAFRKDADWQHLTIGRVDPWSIPFTWCDSFFPDSMKDAYRGYRALWKDPIWRSALRTAIGLYVTANRPNPVEVAIIAAQSGLELLGWLSFVESGRIASKDWQNPKHYPAHKKIRLLLADGGIDPAIPSKLKNLVGLSSSWSDGPSVVAGVRNRLVHPRSSGGSVGWPGEVLADVWLLSSRYLELVLLHKLDVRSDIRDRLGSPWVGSTVSPPWV